MAVSIKKGSVGQKLGMADFLQQLQKDHGEEIGSFGGKLVEADRIPTGLFPLDLALAGGFPRGSASTIYGPESSGKTNIVLRAIAMHQLLWPNDVCVFFDIENSFEVARCVRGKTKGGQPQWNQTEVLYNQTSVDWCDWSANAFSDGGAVDGGINPGPPDAGASLDGGMSVMALYPRIHITPDTDLRSSLALLTTCPQADVSAEANDGPLDVSGRPADVSWIEFMDFGAAEQSDLTPELRSEVPGDFVINFGGRLRANFHLILQDSRVITAGETEQPKPAPLIGGTLDGYFDFELARGRAAQAFP